jgi:hypothetical protein
VTPTSPGDRSLAGDRPRLLAVSDLHVGFPANQAIAERIQPVSPADWLIVAGDVGERAADIESVLGLLAERFAKVVWVPGNHELWTHSRDPVRLRGEERYLHLVEICRRLGVVTPEDVYPIWAGDDHPVVVAPLFVLYDYSFRPAGADSPSEALAKARGAGVVSTDERWLYPDPFPSRAAWCEDRLAKTEGRLAKLPPGLRTVLVNHFPLVREPTSVMRYRSSRSGAARCGRPTGRCGTAPRSWSTDTCTFRGRRGMTGYGTRRCRWAIRASGSAAPPRR